MDPTPFLPWVYGGILVAVHYWGEEIAAHPHAPKLKALAAGVTVSYVFLELFPQYHAGIDYVGQWGFFSVLIGFSLPHIAEAFIIQHENSIETIRKEFKEIHTVFVFAYYALIGVLIHALLQQSVVKGTLLFIPVLLHTAISSLSLAELHRDVMGNRVVHAAVMLSVLLGIGAAAVLALGDVTIHLVLGFITGMFLYVVISDATSQKGGDVRAFSIGLAVYSAAIVLLWQLF